MRDIRTPCLNGLADTLPAEIKTVARYSVLNPDFLMTGKQARWITMSQDEISQMPVFINCRKMWPELGAPSFQNTIDRMADVYGWRVYKLPEPQHFQKNGPGICQEVRRPGSGTGWQGGSYHQSAAGEMISWLRAIQELKAHGIPLQLTEMEEFQRDCWEVYAVDNEEIDAVHVLDWLGY